jgi:hypothetical protein
VLIRWVLIRWVLIRDPLGKVATQALLCTDQETDPIQILLWFARRWQMEVTFHEVTFHEVTFHEVRAHLGVETQRQTPVVGAGYCPYHSCPCPLGTVLPGHARGA